MWRWSPTSTTRSTCTWSASGQSPRGDKQPLPHDGGPKDTVSLRPSKSVELLTRFDSYRDRYLFHCHNAEHEDMEMTNLEIV
ncbi:multicopper oxidase domain-containing protein [Nocardia cyriacigeorgica]|uniref:multicopper oxidase domain-containing protein n=1 Tax=Nocardia cyriacigeorgica TaxID=135487 RepID=UPI0028115505|nr:multicopper oxidase domain-containing protein [Nocardia cyriacigeorgica]